MRKDNFMVISRVVLSPRPNGKKYDEGGNPGSRDRSQEEVERGSGIRITGIDKDCF